MGWGWSDRLQRGHDVARNSLSGDHYYWFVTGCAVWVLRELYCGEKGEKGTGLLLAVLCGYC